MKYVEAAKRAFTNDLSGTWPKDKSLKERGAITQMILETGLAVSIILSYGDRRKHQADKKEQAYAQAVMLRNGRTQEFVDQLLKETMDEIKSKKGRPASILRCV